MNDHDLSQPNEFAIFSTHYTPTEAFLIKETLVAGGVLAFVENADVVRVNPWLANGGSGVIVRVRVDQMSEAQKIIASLRAGELQLDGENLVDQDDSAETNVTTEYGLKPFQIYQHQNKKPAIIAVKRGFSWLALWLGPLWFLANTMWLTFCVSFGLIWGVPQIVDVVSEALGWDNNTSTLIALSINLLVWLLIGTVANFLLGEELKLRGYQLKTVVQAKSSNDAVFDFREKTGHQEL